MSRLKTQIMGILNVTPDSFYDQGQFFSSELAIAGGLKLFNEGADIIDIGGESTRPCAHPVSEKEELERVLPVIKGLKNKISIPLSIDTMKAGVAQAALKAGATLINDVSGFRDPDMIAVAAEASVKICVMHMQGVPKTMQTNPVYSKGVVEEIIQWFDEKVNTLIRAGVKEKNIIFDPGIGFGKTVEDNYKILHNLQKFRVSGFPILLGISRKSFMGKVLKKPAKDLLAPTVALGAIAMRENIDFLRVHDVEEHRSIAVVMEKYLDGAESLVYHE